MAVEDENAEYSPAMHNLASNQALVDEVKNNEAAIGYVGLGYLDPDVTVAAIDGVQASVETAADGSYPISRYLYMYSDGEPEGVSRPTSSGFSVPMARPSPRTRASSRFRSEARGLTELSMTEEPRSKRRRVGRSAISRAAETCLPDG